MLKVLIISVGSLVGYNVLDALERRRENIEIVATNSIPGDSNIYRCDKAYLVPPTKSQSAEFTNRLVEIIEVEKPDLVIPARDDDLRVLSSIREKRPDLAPIILCGNQKSVRHITDKWFTYQFSKRYNLPFVASAIPNLDSEHTAVRQLVAKYGYPVLAKPRSGYASHGVVIITGGDQLNHTLNLKDNVIQRYLSPSRRVDQFYEKIRNQGIPLFFSLEEAKYSLQTFIYQDCSIGKIFCTLHKMVSGRSLKVEKITDDRLEDIAFRFASALAKEGWFGPLNIQCQKLPSGDFMAFELNGRFTGATSARYYLGFDEVGNTLNTLCRFEFGNNGQLVPKSQQVNRYVATLPIPDKAAGILHDQGVWYGSQRRGH